MFRARKTDRENAYVENLTKRLASEWNDFSPEEAASVLDVPCRSCPKYRPFPPRCIVPLGSRLRSCVCASIEYHLRNAKDLRVLEIGCGENSFTRQVVEAAGGSWVGTDPRPSGHGRESVRMVEAQANHLPFNDESFNVVVGVQTIEHWECAYSEVKDCDYISAMAEVWRVLRPGGFAYFDAPIHLHGAACFISGDLEGIRRIFSTQPWDELRFMAWRRRHWPFRKKIASKKERVRWSEVFSGDPDALESLRGKSAWILSIRAEKP